MSRETRIFTAGHRGLVSSAHWRHFTAQGFQNLIGRTREFLHVDDLAHACHIVPDCYDDRPINVGTWEDVSIAELAGLVADIVGYRGEICWDTDKPDGTYRKLLDVQRIKELGWNAKISLTEGIRMTYEWFLDLSTTIAVE
jgi:nucleoside-diphosphate-sugar epimerase